MNIATIVYKFYYFIYSERKRLKKMNKKNLLITSAIISLSLLNVSDVQAETSSEKPQDEQIEEINQHSTEQSSPSNSQEKFNRIFKELHTILNDDQKEIIEQIDASENEASLLFKEAVVTHETSEFNQAIEQYDELLAVILETTPEEINREITELIELFKELAEEEHSLLKYDFSDKESDELDEPKELESTDASEKDSSEPENIDPEKSIKETDGSNVEDQKIAGESDGIIEEEIELSSFSETDKNKGEADSNKKPDEEKILEISSVSNVNYRGYLTNSSHIVYSNVDGSSEYEELEVEDLQGQEVKVLQEAETQQGSVLYIDVIGTNITGWITESDIDIESVSSQQVVSNYRGYLTRSNDTINTEPWGTPGYEEIRRVEDLQGNEVKVLEEAETQRATWLYVDVMGTNISGWIDKAGVEEEAASSQQAVSNYRGYLMRSNDTINTEPWGTPGYEEIRRVEDLQGNEVKVLEEAETQRATWLYVDVMGTNISGWIDKEGIEEEAVSSQQAVSNYRGYLIRSNDTINTQPWGTPGYEEIRRVKDLQGTEVKILKEAETQRATWLYVDVMGTNISGWIDKAGIEEEAVSSQQAVSNYRGYLSRPNDTINTQPWGTPGYEEIRHVEDLQGTEIKVLEEAQTQRATWLYVDIMGTSISGWIDKAGIEEEAISSQKDVNYQAYLSRSSDSINTQPWGTFGNETIRLVGDLHGREVEVVKEAETQRATWAFVNILGTKYSGWIDKDGLGSHLVYVDPGHGGSDTGASSGGIQEKDLNLSLSKKVRDVLQNMGYTVVMSRDDDSFPNLSDRAQEANKIGADIFVSIHHNAFNGNANGIETFYYNENGNTDNPLANDDKRIKNSRELAESIQSELINETGANDRGVKRANFHVLRETEMSSVLVEGGFIDNAIERAKLVLDSYQQKLANAISKGINRILGS